MLARYPNPKRPRKGKPKRPRVRPAPIDAAWISSCLNRADAVLAAPIAKPHIVRVAPVGALVARFVLPLDFCPSLNRFAELPSFARKRVKDQVATLMLVQQRFMRRLEPLPGRPFVRAIRFTSVEADRDASWCKVPVDRLTGKHGGLGFIQDDRPSKLDLRTWWEPVPPKCGFVLLEVFSGA